MTIGNIGRNVVTLFYEVMMYEILLYDLEKYQFSSRKDLLLVYITLDS
jgi:hypothetical protein